MKPLYKISLILIALLMHQLAIAGGTNTNSPTSPKFFATISANFDAGNINVTVQNYDSKSTTLIDTVILNFEEGSQQKYIVSKTNSGKLKGTGIYDKKKIIGVWVARAGNNPITTQDPSGYGHYIWNPDNFCKDGTTPALYHDFQTDLGAQLSATATTCPAPYNTQKKYYVCHLPPGNPGNQHTIWISCNAVQAHLNNHPGDAVGECGGGGVIPVELVNFNAKMINPEMVKLSWATASEVNNDYIAIEKTSDLNSWEQVCKVHGKGNSTEMNNYSCVDSTAHSGGQNTVYYRPKQVDFNGTYEYFNIIKLRLENSNQANEVESVYPNPATDRIKIQYNASENGIVKIRLMSIEGKAILVSSYNAKQGSQIVDIDLPENDLAKGLYVLEVESAGQLYRQKVYKQ